jgi:hypothetical protein
MMAVILADIEQKAFGRLIVDIISKSASDDSPHRKEERKACASFYTTGCPAWPIASEPERVMRTFTQRRSIVSMDRVTNPLRSRRAIAFVAAAELTPKAEAISPTDQWSRRARNVRTSI